MSYGYYGYYGGYPYTYTIFDGYDFFSEVLLAFDHEGHLKWQQSVKFDNELTYELFPHASEGVCYDELVVASPYHNNLRYTAFDKDAQVLMNQQSEKLAPTHGGDYVEDEYFAQMTKWYGNRFLIYGSQIIQNSVRWNITTYMATIRIDANAAQTATGVSDTSHDSQRWVFASFLIW